MEKPKFNNCRGVNGVCIPVEWQMSKINNVQF